ncbi:MAG TPA: helix-turn-helix domain-containing protein [Sphingomicrobium sp.]|nr:helix-turn-helix domain-containing protein [Sphingomicrobium sp.]
MEEQRTAIARAALNVLLDKGVYETSLREICKEAGVSVGALYTHFATKEEAIVAACALDRVEQHDTPLAANWDAYVGDLSSEFSLRREDRRARRFRLSLQFVAELAMMDTSPPGLSAIYHQFRGLISRNLANLHELGEISLPLGLATTTEIHMELSAGSQYQIAADPELDPKIVADAFSKALAVTAGRHIALAQTPDNQSDSPHSGE